MRENEAGCRTINVSTDVPAVTLNAVLCASWRLLSTRVSLTRRHLPNICQIAKNTDRAYVWRIHTLVGRGKR